MTNRLRGYLLGASAMALAMGAAGVACAQNATAPVVAAAVDTAPISQGKAQGGVVVLDADARHHRLLGAAARL